MTNQVKIAQLPGRIKQVDLPEEGMVIGQVLAIAEFNADGYSLKLNGTPAEIQARVQAGDTIYLIEKIEGNN